MLRPVYTETENCQDCYKCIRECPVKAIKVEDNRASIIEERCIYCGHCTQVCPTGAKKVRDGLTRARLAITRYPGKVYLSLAPSYISEFIGISDEALVLAIKSLGFAGVSETALGAEIVSAKTEEYLNLAPADIYISSACPVVVEYILKYSEEHIRCITPILSPMLAHAKILKELYGDDIKVIFAGPCIGKKSESDKFSDMIDVAITFKDLKKWLEAEGLLHDTDNISVNTPPLKEFATYQDTTSVDNNSPYSGFIPYRAQLGAAYPIEGGMLAGLHKSSSRVHYMAFSDLHTIKEVLNELKPVGQDSIFLELLACRGGCINGPAKMNDNSIALKRYNIVKRFEEGGSKGDFRHLDLDTGFLPDLQSSQRNYSADEIKEALLSIGKSLPEDELNCSSCGYDSCHDFAIAMLDGVAEYNMCASYMRKIAHDKANVILQKIPSGVVLINSQMKVLDMNRSFASAMGNETLEIYDIYPGMDGADFTKICPFDGLFRTVLATGEEIKERPVKVDDRMWLLSIYNIQSHRLIFGLLQDLKEPTVRKEWMLEKTREVITNHMATVQKVAGLLGENAAFTDSTLRSIIETYNSEAKSSDDSEQTESSEKHIDEQ